MNEVATERPVIDADEAAKRLGVSLSMVYKLIDQGRLEGYAVGRRKKLYADSLDSYRQSNAISRREPARKEPAPSLRRRKKEVKPLDLPTRRHLR